MKVSPGFVFVFLLCWYSGYSVSSAEVAKLRNLYFNAAMDKYAAENFSKLMEGTSTGSDPVLICYKGLSKILDAKYGCNPYAQLTDFIAGRKMLDAAVNAAPGNIEVRFMRYCVETSAPSFLGYDADIESDKNIIIAAWGQLQDRDLKMRIKDYMIHSQTCTQNDKNQLK